MDKAKEITRRYTKDDFDVIWKPARCMHSGICFRGLPGVFDPRRRPWIIASEADGDAIKKQVAKCPSGALSIESHNLKQTIMENQNTEKTRITISSKGPILVKGPCVFVDDQGNEEMKEGNFALCRCGGSSKKPFCDGTHRNNSIL
jgi:uncharacterized Fe-S cluster protein YjdI